MTVIDIKLLEYLERKFEDVRVDQVGIKDVLLRNTISLEEHMRRTEILELNLSKQSDKHTVTSKEVQNMVSVYNTLKWVGGLGGISAVIAVVKYLFKL